MINRQANRLAGKRAPTDKNNRQTIPHSAANAKQRISDQRTADDKANLVPARATHYCTCKQYWSFPCS